jgi:plastocyanin
MRGKITLISILLGATIVLAGCGGGAPQGEQPSEGDGEATQGDQEAMVVTMRDTSFVQSRIAVPPGTTVRWVNEDSFPHTVVSTEPEGLFDSGNVAAGESFEFTFEDAGEVAYVCEIHPSMTGTAVVREGGGATVLEGGSGGDDGDGGVY